ncbi:hypothetical protein PV326_013610, partial [Microctonus aethiopoides]
FSQEIVLFFQSYLRTPHKSLAVGEHVTKMYKSFLTNDILVHRSTKGIDYSALSVELKIVENLVRDIKKPEEAVLRPSYNCETRRLSISHKLSQKSVSKKSFVI